jgi:hypothetical protein
MSTRFSRLRRAFLAVLAMATVAALAFQVGSAIAQPPGGKQVQPPGGKQVQQPQGPKQVQLTPKHVEQYLAAYKELTPMFEKLDASGAKPDPKMIAALTAAIKKYGFRDLDEYDSVAGSIVAVLDGIDPKTRQYSDPIASIKKEMAAVQADKKMNPAERKKALESLNAELGEVQPVQHPANIPLVIKYYDRLSAITQQK